MLHNIILGTYRLVALFLVTFPIILNFVYRGDIATSLIYVPASMLILGFLAAYLDKKIERAVVKAQKEFRIKKLDSAPARPHYNCLLYRCVKQAPTH